MEEDSKFSYEKETSRLAGMATFRFGSTMYKNKSRDSSKFKGCSPLQLSCNLTGKCHAIGYYSYTCPLAASVKTEN